VKKTGKIPLIIAILSLSMITQCNDTTSVIMQSLVEEFPDHSPVTIQFVMQMGMIGSFCVSLAVGFLTSRFYIKHMLLTAALVILAGGSLPHFFHDNLYLLYVFAFIVGAGQGCLVPLLGTLIVHNFEGKQKDRLLGMNITFATIGSTILLFIAGPLVLSHWTNVYYIYLIAVPVFFIALFLLPKGEKAPPAPKGEKTKIPVPAKGWIQSIMVVMMFLCYVSFPLNISMYVEGSGLGNAADVSMAMMVITVVGAAIGVVFQPLIKVVKLFIGTLAAAFGFMGLLMVIFAPNIWMIYIAAALLGVFFGGQMCSNGYIVSRICKPEEVGPTFSIFSSFMTAGVVISPIVLNFIMKLWGGVGPTGTFTTAAVFFGVVLALQILWNIYLTKTCPPVDTPKPIEEGTEA
jgi:MFS family permease